MNLRRSFLLLTAVRGIVDAVSFLKCGHVFVANMTGNVLFVGFCACRLGRRVAAGVAPGGGCVGSLAAGRLATTTKAADSRLLRMKAGLQLDCFAAAIALGVLGVGRYPLIGVLSLAMGLQNATARRIAVPDLTTTVLTMSLTGLAADSDLAGGSGSHASVRLLAVAALVAGALVGAVRVLHAAVWAPLGLAALLLAAVAVAPDWSPRLRARARWHPTLGWFPAWCHSGSVRVPNGLPRIRKPTSGSG